VQFIMKSRITLFVLVGILCLITDSSPAQGTLQAVLSPYSPSVSPLSATAVVQTPDTSFGGPYFSVAYTITVNTNSPIFSVGRIAGGSTAWAFDLSTTSVSGDSLIYSGTTGMAAFQINDMLSNFTDFEIYAYAGDGSLSGFAAGQLVAVPEPRYVFLLLAGFATAVFFRKATAHRCPAVK